MPPSSRLTSRQHPLVKRFRRVAARRDRDREVLLDGEHLLHEALRAGVRLQVVLLDERHAALADAARAAGAEVHDATPAVIDAASPVRTPSGVVAIAEWSPVPVPRAFEASPPFALGLVGVQDPGNVGSIIRAADALEAGAVLALDGTADPGGWKALRGAMGSTFRLPVATGASAGAVAEARRRDWRILAAHPAAGSPIDALDLTVPTLVLLGSEGAGLPDELRSLASAAASIRMRAGVESLNVAVTAALIAAEARRQRVTKAAVERMEDRGDWPQGGARESVK